MEFERPSQRALEQFGIFLFFVTEIIPIGITAHMLAKDFLGEV